MTDTSNTATHRSRSTSARRGHPPGGAGAAHGTARAPLLGRGVVLAFLLLASFATGVVLSILGPTVPAIAERLGIPETTLGVLFTINFLMATATTIAAGAYFNRISARLLIPAGLLAMVAGMLAEGAAATFALVMLGALLAGAGTGIINVSVNATAARLNPDRRGSVLTWLNVSFGIGAFATPLVAGYSLTHWGSYTPTYVAGAVVLAIPIVPLLLGLPARSADAQAGGASGGGGNATTLRALGTLVRDRALWPLMAMALLYLGAEIGFGGWIISIVATMTHLPPAQLAPTASAFWIFLAIGGAPTTLLLRRGVAPRQLILAGALAATAATLLLMLLGGSVPLAVGCCALIGLAFSPILPLTTALAASQGERDGSDGARVAALFTTGQVGAAAFPALQGALLGAGPVLALSLTAACTLGMAALARPDGGRTGRQAIRPQPSQARR